MFLNGEKKFIIVFFFFFFEFCRLEASKSREGANLEYLKNVFVNYLTTNDSARKRHMLNAITAVLRFTKEESEKIVKRK